MLVTWCSVVWAAPAAEAEAEAAEAAEAATVAEVLAMAASVHEDRVTDPVPVPAVPRTTWSAPPLGAPQPVSPLPWVVAGIGGTLAAVGAVMAAPTWDPERPVAADGTRTVVAGGAVGVGGVVWGAVQAGRARR